MTVWSEIGDFVFQPGERFAVLASVSRNYALAQVASTLQGKGFSVTYSWEQGSPTRDASPIDTWLSNLPPDPTSNHRWLYAEGDYQGSAACKEPGQVIAQ